MPPKPSAIIGQWTDSKPIDVASFVTGYVQNCSNDMMMVTLASETNNVEYFTSFKPQFQGIFLFINRPFKITLNKSNDLVFSAPNGFLALALSLAK